MRQKGKLFQFKVYVTVVVFSYKLSKGNILRTTEKNDIENTYELV